MKPLITFDYELKDNDWVAKRGDKILCRFSDDFVSALAVDYGCDKVMACEILLGGMFVHYFSFTDGIAERQIVKMIFH